MTSTSSIRAHDNIWEMIRPTLDCVGIFGSWYAVKVVGVGYFDDAAVSIGLVAVAVFLIAARFTGLRRRTAADNINQEIIRICITWAVTVLILGVLAFGTRYGQYFARSVVAAWIVLTPAMVSFLRMITRMIQQLLYAKGIGIRKVAIAGLNDLGRQVSENLQSDVTLGFRVVGFFDDRDKPRAAEHSMDESLRGSLTELVQIAREGEVENIFITLPMRAEKRIRYLLDELSDSTVSVYIVPDFFVFELLHSRWANLGGLPAVSVFENPLFGVDGLSKRVADLAIASFALLAASVPMVIIAAAVKLSSRGPVFFRQKRYGLDGREILVWKFRSMRTCDNGPVVKQATKDDPRITRIGRILRKSSLDELPQLFNVIEGSMSLVGPRPHASAHNEEYRGQIHGYMLRHKVKPGITGLAQVNGCRGETETIDKMQQRVDYDHQYIRTWSLWLDLKILIKTVFIVWKQPEAY